VTFYIWWENPKNSEKNLKKYYKILYMAGMPQIAKNGVKIPEKYLKIAGK